MEHCSLTFSQLGITPTDVCAAMGYKGSAPDPQTEKMIERLLPRFEGVTSCAAFRILEGSVGKESVVIQAQELCTGATIASVLRGAGRFAVFVATAGSSFECVRTEFAKEENILEEYVADAIGSVIAVKTGEYLDRQIARRVEASGEHLTNSFSPGHCKWTVADQPKIFALLGETCSCGVSLTDSFLMHPVKSISGIIGIGREVQRKQNSCDICTLTTCFRRNTTHH